MRSLWEKHNETNPWWWKCWEPWAYSHHLAISCLSTLCCLSEYSLVMHELYPTFFWKHLYCLMLAKYYCSSNILVLFLPAWWDCRIFKEEEHQAFSAQSGWFSLVLVTDLWIVGKFSCQIYLVPLFSKYLFKAFDESITEPNAIRPRGYT